MLSAPHNSAARSQHALRSAVHISRTLAMCGIAIVLCLPAARGSDAWLGWWPLWLVLMPAAAWIALLLRQRHYARTPSTRRHRNRQAERRPSRHTRVAIATKQRQHA